MSADLGLSVDREDVGGEADGSLFRCVARLCSADGRILEDTVIDPSLIFLSLLVLGSEENADMRLFFIDNKVDIAGFVLYVAEEQCLSFRRDSVAGERSVVGTDVLVDIGDIVRLVGSRSGFRLKRDGDVVDLSLGCSGFEKLDCSSVECQCTCCSMTSEFELSYL